MKEYDKVVFFEECYKYGSIGEKYAADLSGCERVAIDGFVAHGRTDLLLDSLGLSANCMAKTLERYL
jgi:1-deoxy-D-xylulose-5-phosphate synthase